MSEMGQERTFADVRITSCLAPESGPRQTKDWVWSGTKVKPPVAYDDSFAVLTFQKSGGASPRLSDFCHNL
jgi:hypothetical protein